MNATAETMKTLPIKLLKELRGAAEDDRREKRKKAGYENAGHLTGSASVTHHRNHLKRVVTAVLDGSDLLSVGYELTNKKTGMTVTRRDIVKGGREFLKVERWRTDNERWGATLLYWEWSNIRQLEQELLLAYHLALEDK